MQDLSKTNLEGKYVVVSANAYHSPTVFERIFHCESGFGLDPEKSGTKIYGHFVADNEECYVRRYDVERLATEQEVQQAITVNQAREALGKKTNELVNPAYEGAPEMEDTEHPLGEPAYHTVVWVSEHEILPAQVKALKDKLGDIKLVRVSNTYQDYMDVVRIVKSYKATHAVLVLPLSMIALILDSREGKGITWLRAEMCAAHEGECTEISYKETVSDQHNTVMQLEHQCSKFNPETDVMSGENGNRHRRFLEFKILKGIKIKTEPFTGERLLGTTDSMHIEKME